MATHDILVAAGLILVVLQAGKVFSTVCAVRWNMIHGRDFAVLLKTHESDLSEQTYWRILDSTDAGRVLPFGVLEYRMLRFASRMGALSGRLIRLARLMFYDFTSLGLASMAYMYLTSTPVLSAHASVITTVLAATSAVLVVIQLISLYAEACVSYASIGSYGLGFHKANRYLKVRATRPSYVTEIKVLAGAVIYSLASGAFMLYFVSWHGGRFDSLNVTGTTPERTILDLLNCCYFSLTTFFTADSPGPITGPARLVAAGIVAQGVCALVLVLSTFAMYAVPRGEETSRAVAPQQSTESQFVDDLPPSGTATPIGDPPRRTTLTFMTGAAVGGLVAYLLGSRTTARQRKRT